MREILKFYSPLLALILLVMAFSLILNFHPNPGCERILGTNLSFAGIVVYLLVYPLICLVAACYAFIIGVRSIKSGAFPSPEIPGLSRINQLKGIPALLISGVLVVTPIFAVWLLGAGTYSFITILQGYGIIEFQQQMELGCALA